MVKLLKDKDKRILKRAREKLLMMYNGYSMRLTAAFSSETVETRRQLENVFMC